VAKFKVRIEVQGNMAEILKWIAVIVYLMT